ncbi:MAG: hypothetical protein ABWZ52_11365, partial [Acidimicrobiales bacterium]
LVRVCRPDADRSFDAILERVERLERGQAGAPPAAIQSADRAPEVASGARGGPADAAREELAKAGATRAPRRPVTKATAPKAVSAPAPAAAEASAPSSSAAPAAELPTNDELEAAWPGVVDGLKGAAKGMFRDARFEVTPDAVVLTVPTGPPLEELEKRWPGVEQALAAHFGRSVPTRLAVDAAVGPPAEAERVQDDEPVDVHELEDAPAGGTGVDRLAEAFPGAELVDE